MLEEPEKRAEEYYFVERVRAIKTLFTFTTGFPKKECQRGAAISVSTALCGSRGFRRRKESSTIKSEQEEIVQSSLSASCIFCWAMMSCRRRDVCGLSPVMAIGNCTSIGNTSAIIQTGSLLHAPAVQH